LFEARQPEIRPEVRETEELRLGRQARTAATDGHEVVGEDVLCPPACCLLHGGRRWWWFVF
jgi:hypothetical protein